MIVWFRRRRALHAELRQLEQHAGALAARNARLEKSNAGVRRTLAREQREHETTARKLQDVRARLDAIEAAGQ